MSVWYFNKNLKPQGPLDFEELKRKILRGEIGPQDLILKDGEEVWRPAAEWRELRADLFPAFQKKDLNPTDPEVKEWILLSFTAETPQGRQQGPYSVQDLCRLLQEQTISAEDYVWRSGLTGWVQIKDRPEFSAGKPGITLDL